MTEYIEAANAFHVASLDMERATMADPDRRRALRFVENALIGMEGLCVAGLVTAVLRRGARVSDIHRYIHDGDECLPLCGCEREILDTIVAALRGRGWHRAGFDRLIDALAVLVTVEGH